MVMAYSFLSMLQSFNLILIFWDYTGGMLVHADPLFFFSLRSFTAIVVYSVLAIIHSVVHSAPKFKVWVSVLVPLYSR